MSRVSSRIGKKRWLPSVPRMTRTHTTPLRTTRCRERCGSGTCMCTIYSKSSWSQNARTRASNYQNSPCHLNFKIHRGETPEAAPQDTPPNAQCWYNLSHISAVVIRNIVHLAASILLRMWMRMWQELRRKIRCPMRSAGRIFQVSAL